MTDYADDPEYKRWAKDVQENLIPKLDDSAMTISMVPSGPTDVKFAVELGLSIMMGKPIIAAVSPGTRVPRGLVKVADEIVEVDMDQPEKAQKAIFDAMVRIENRVENDGL